MLEAKFNAGDSAVKVDYWNFSREEHQDDGFHCYCTLKLTGCKNWLSVKNRITEKHGIQVNFSDKHNFNLSAYRYALKEVSHSENNLLRALESCLSKNKKVNCRIFCCLCYKQEVTKGESSRGVAKKRKSLINLDLSEFIRKGIHWASCNYWVAENCSPDGHYWIRIHAKWKNAQWTCYQNLANGLSQRKTRSQESISIRYSVVAFDFWLCWRLFCPLVSVFQRSSSAHWNGHPQVFNQY